MTVEDLSAMERLAFRGPLITTRTRRGIVLHCQGEWDQHIAQQAGKMGRATHLTILSAGEAQEYAVAEGRQIAYPLALTSELRNARDWARKRSARPPALSF